MENLKIGGSLLFLGVTQFFICLMIAESLYPSYNVSTNTISDLGATCNPNCVIYQPSSMIFNSSVILLGIMAFIGSYFVFLSGYHLLAILMMIASLGAIGIGLFPETTGTLHLLVSGITFFFTGISAIISYWVSRLPMSLISFALGLITLVVFFLYAGALFFGSGYLGLGPGGLERVMAYAALIWVIGIGAHFMGRTG